MANANTNTAANAATNMKYPQTYYDRKLLQNAKTVLVYAKYGLKRSIPENHGTTINFRRFVPIADTVNAQLTDGITPDGLTLTQEEVECTINQYGVYYEVSDLLKMSSYDDVKLGCTENSADFLGRVLDHVARDRMLATTQAQFCGGHTGRTGITGDDKLTYAEIRKGVRQLKKNKAPQFTREGGRPHYICIVDPDTEFDLQGAGTIWEDIGKYNAKEKIYDGELGRMFGVVFVVSTEGKVYKQSVVNAVSANTNASADFVLKNDPTAAAVAYLTAAGNKIKIGDAEYTISSYAAATKTVTLSAAATLTANAIVYSEDAGAPDASTKIAPDVHCSLLFGKDAYGIVDIGGKGNVHMIDKALGSSGTLDPLNQRATIGGKVEAFNAVVLNNNWIRRIEHAVSV